MIPIDKMHDGSQKEINLCNCELDEYDIATSYNLLKLALTKVKLGGTIKIVRFDLDSIANAYNNGYLSEQDFNMLMKKSMTSGRKNLEIINELDSFNVKIFRCSGFRFYIEATREV